jgi:flavin reductase (DIM6/NTAB) family NADH-FMN oxidoreductase RutF
MNPYEMDLPLGESLRRSMRRWASGVAVATSLVDHFAHGMTVNSFVSVSVDPPLVTVTMAHNTRTYVMVQESGIYAVTILSRQQQYLAELFAGRVPDEGDRMQGLEVFSLVTGAPLLVGGSAFIDCRVIHSYAMPLSTLFVAEVVSAHVSPVELAPLIYYNRDFTGLVEAI